MFAPRAWLSDNVLFSLALNMFVLMEGQAYKFFHRKLIPVMTLQPFDYLIQV